MKEEKKEPMLNENDRDTTRFMHTMYADPEIDDLLFGNLQAPVAGLKLVVLGEPRAQKRHRNVNMGKFTRQYDPSAADKGDFLSVVQNKAPDKPFDVPLMLSINFFFTRPKSHYKTGKNAHMLKDVVPVWHVSKPDTDNCFKFCTDALNKIFWRDDSLICNVNVKKQYSDNPRIEILITPLVSNL